MSVLPVGFGGEEVSGYTIANSLRFRASASAYLSRTFATPTDIKKFTFSCWCKRGALGTNMPIIQGGPTGTVGSIAFVTDQIYVHLNSSVGATLVTTQLARDPSAWMSIVVALDTTQAVASDRAKLYVNGAQVTSFASTNYPALNDTGSRINAALSHTIGYGSGLATYLDGYLSDVYFIDGQALDPTSFGQFNSDGVWTPKAYTGTYGTNGFYLKFNDGSNLTNLCLDRSGNGNNWTATNVSLTAGATYDWMVDTPSVNYCVLNRLDTATTATLSNANLRATTATSTQQFAHTAPVPAGKWFAEFAHVNIVNDNSNYVGVQASTGGTPTRYYGSSGNLFNGTSWNVYGGAWASPNVIGVAADTIAGTVEFFRDGVSQGQVSFGTGDMYFRIAAFISGGVAYFDANFGQRPWAYPASVPSGFKALNTANLPAVTVPNGRKNFDVLLYTGDNTTPKTRTGVDFTPDFLWVKSRGSAADHGIANSVSGTGAKVLSSNTTSAEGNAGGNIDAFVSGGFTTSSGSLNHSWFNSNATAYAAWLWKAGGAAVTNTAGSISSQVSANTAAGISIVTYTGTGGTGTVGHGLGVTPAMIIYKDRGAVGAWTVMHKSLANMTAEFLKLNTTDAKTNLGSSVSAPTSTVFGVSSSTSAATTCLALVFAEVAGFSRFGSYTGNGSAEGPNITCGFKPRWVMVKRTDGGTASWVIVDAVRDTVNVAGLQLIPNQSIAEPASSPTFDFTANGFKVRTSSDTNINVSGGTYIFAAFAENPFGGSNVAPATAR